MPIDLHGASLNCDSSGSAGFLGTLQSVLGLIGLSGLIDPTHDSDLALEKARQDLQKATEEWNQKLSDAKSEIVQDQLTYLQNLTNFSSVQTSAVETSLQEQITVNFTLIIMLVFLVIFLILFDIF
jgi:hypothetical protein